MNGDKAKKTKEKLAVMRLRSGHLTLFWRGRQRNVPKCKTHVQSNVLAH